MAYQTRLILIILALVSPGVMAQMGAAGNALRGAQMSRGSVGQDSVSRYLDSHKPDAFHPPPINRPRPSDLPWSGGGYPLSRPHVKTLPEQKAEKLEDLKQKYEQDTGRAQSIRKSLTANFQLWMNKLAALKDGGKNEFYRQLAEHYNRQFKILDNFEQMWKTEFDYGTKVIEYSFGLYITEFAHNRPISDTLAAQMKKYGEEDDKRTLKVNDVMWDLLKKIQAKEDEFVVSFTKTTEVEP